MNETTAKLLNGLQSSRARLAEILNNKNVEAASDEPLNDLVEKAELIHGGVEFGEWVPTVNTAILTIGGLKFLPYKIGLSCEALAGQSIYGEEMRYVSLFSANMGEENTSLYSGTTGEAGFGNVPGGSVVTVTTEPDGTYTITVDFTAWNEGDNIAYTFKGGYEYMWVTATKEWSL